MSHNPLRDRVLQGAQAAVPLLFALIAAAPLLLHTGFLNTRAGGDSPFLLFRLHELYIALRQGVFPVRWMPHAAFGLGYPFFNYYAALPYYLAAGFKWLGFSYVFSLKLTHLAGFVLAAYGMYAWVKRVTGWLSAAWLASAAYTFAPFHLVNVYVRGDSLSEFWAMAWFPLILLALHEAARRLSARRLVGVALALSALVMTHNVSALIFLPFAAVYGLGCAVWPALPSSLPHPSAPSPSGGEGGQAGMAAWRVASLPALGGLLGLALAAWVWVPALGETSYVQLAEQTTGYFFYGNHFRSVDLIQPGFFFDYDTGKTATTPFSMGLAQAVLVGGGAVALVWRMIRERAWWRDGFLLLGLAASTWMITPASSLIWKHVPLLPFAQFPWRFLSVQALFGAAVGGALTTIPWPAFHRLEHRNGPASRYAAVLLGLVLGLAGLGRLNPDFIPLTDADVNPQRLAWYESFSGNIGTTIRYEYLPTWTRPRPYSSEWLLGREPRARFLAGEGVAQRIEAGAADQTWAFEVTSESAQVALPLLYWPGWRAAILRPTTRTGVTRAEPLVLSPLEGLGYVQMTLPSGAYTVRLWLGRTPLRMGAELASLVALVTLIGLWRPRLDWMGWTLIMGAFVSVVVLAMILPTIPQKAQSAVGLLTADFGREAYFTARPGGVVFADGSRLLAAHVTVENGRLHPSLTWAESEAPESFSVSLAAPPQQADQGAPSYPVDVPLDSPTPGLYFVRVSSPDNPALSANGQPRSDLYLAPLVIPPWLGQLGGDLAVNVDFGPARLLSVEAQGVDGTLAVTLWWQALRQAERHYAVALRLLDVAGQEWAALDTQAGGAGLYPTGLWQPGEIVPDNYWLTLPMGMPPGSYTLGVTLYDATTLEPVGRATVERLAYERLSQRCPAPDDDDLHSGIGVEHVNLPKAVQEGEMLRIEIAWLVAQQPDQIYQVQWLAQGESLPHPYAIQTALAPGSDPRTWRPDPGCSVYVLGRHHLDLPAELPPGEYTLSLRLLSEDGQPLSQLLEVGAVQVEGRERLFDVPSLATPLEVTFGGQIKLWGYTVQQSDEALEIELAWGAVTEPDTDYVFFVHLFDPASEQIVAQIDAMPRNYTYPTSLWATDEVVVETLVLSLSKVPPGEYRLALGWYKPGGDRLPAATVDGTPLPDGRVILTEPIRVR